MPGRYFCPALSSTSLTASLSQPIESETISDAVTLEVLLLL
jgi:hypothetical protein